MRRVLVIFVAVLIVIVVACGTIHHRNIRAQRMMTACISNLHCITSAKEQWATTNSASNGTPVSVDNILKPGYVRSGMLSCPVAGSNAYIIGRAGEHPRCRVHGEFRNTHLPKK